LQSAELYRTATGDFVQLGQSNQSSQSNQVSLMAVARERHSATLLADGRVLVTGGTVAQPSAAADLYDPLARTFTAAANLNVRRAAHSATLLRDGRVLIAGGAESLESVLRSVEIYDPSDNTFISAGLAGRVGQMQVSRYKHAGVLLADGTVLLLGGADERDWGGRRQSVEIYDPVSGTSRLITPLNRARFKLLYAVAVTPGGDVIVSGGGRRIEVYAAGADRFALGAGSLSDEWFYATATALPDGRVFIAGGYNDSLNPTNQTWMYQPPDKATPKLARRFAVVSQ
jgi:hypothetical protein